jgi:hypothetical protein
MRHQIAMGLKTWWRYKAWLGMAVITTFIAGGYIYVASNRVFHGLGGPGHLVQTLAAETLPLSIGWYCRAAFVVSLTIGAGVIAGDVGSGAFTFYFARSVRPRDYMLGKLAGLAVLTAILTMVGPLLLALLQLGLSGSRGEALAHLAIVPKALAAGAAGTIAFATVPLGFSALAGTRRSALALWAAYYLVGGSIAIMIGAVTHASWIAALDLPTAVTGIAYQLFDVRLLGNRLASVSLTAGVVSITVQAVAAIAIAGLAVSRAQKSGVGGAT